MNRLRKIDIDIFRNITKPEVAYLLGLIWADGCIYYKKNKYRYDINIVNKIEDALVFNKIAQTIGEWNFYLTQKGKMGAIVAHNKDICEFLIENDYLSKSSLSANKILSRIPEHLKHYWFRGLLDGDGCIYVKYNPTSLRLEISSSFEQDWSYMVDLCTKLNIEYKILKRTAKNTKYKFSTFLIRKLNCIMSFCDYVYRGFDNDKIGLQRKFLKAKEIESFLKKRQARNRQSSITKRGDGFYIMFRYNKKRYNWGCFNNKEEALISKQNKIFEILGKDGFKEYYGFDYKPSLTLPTPPKSIQN